MDTVGLPAYSAKSVSEPPSVSPSQLIPQLQAVYNSGKATIQARLIILELTRILASHRWRFAMNLNFCGASDSFFYQWCPNLEEAEDAARYCAIILSRWVRVAAAGGRDEGMADGWDCNLVELQAEMGNEMQFTAWIKFRVQMESDANTLCRDHSEISNIRLW